MSNYPCWFSMLQIVRYSHLILFKINNFVFSSGSASKNARYFLSLVTVSTASRKLAIFVSAIGAISQGMMPVRMVDGRDVSKAPGHFPQRMSYRTKERASDEDEDAGLTGPCFLDGHRRSRLYRGKHSTNNFLKRMFQRSAGGSAPASRDN